MRLIADNSFAYAVPGRMTAGGSVRGLTLPLRGLFRQRSVAPAVSPNAVKVAQG